MQLFGGFGWDNLLCSKGNFNNMELSIHYSG